MRWLFAFLVFINIFFYIWHHHQTLITTTRTNTPIDDYSLTIKLAAEQPELKTPIIVENTNVTNELEPLTCLYLGGFTNQEQLIPISTYLERIGKEINLKTIKLEQIPKLMLYVQIFDATTKSATLEKLNKSLINTLMITRGALKDHISLGIFANSEDYIHLEEKLNNLGIPFTTKNLSESATSYWLKVPPNKRLLFTDSILLNLLRDLPTVQQELMLCNTIN